MARVGNPVSSTATLLINGYALVANAGLTAVLGIVFWMLTTRLYTQDQVGLGAALISSMTTISYLSQMNLSSFLTRFIPLTQAGTGRLILKAYAAAGALTAVVATLFSLGVGVFAEPLEMLRGNAAALGLFVAASVIWTIFALQDAVLSGLRRSVLVPIENLVFSVLKIGFLVGLSLVAVPALGGVFLAWTLPLIPLVVAVNALIFARLPMRGGPGRTGGPDLGTVTRFLGWDFLGSLSLAVGFGLAPILITAKTGVAATATYHLAWSFAYSIYLIGRAMSVSLVAEGAAQPMRLQRLVADTLFHTLLMVGGAVVVLVAGAELVMATFGPGYVAEGVPVLRVLVLSCLPWAVTTVYCAAARARGQTRIVAVVQAATLGVFLLLSTTLISSLGALGVALGWLGAHGAVAIGVTVAVMLRGGPKALVDWALALTGSAVRLLAEVRGALPGARNGARSAVAQRLAGIGRAELAGLEPKPLGRSLSDVETHLLVDETRAPEVAKAVLKSASSQRGCAALKRNARVLERLAADGRLGEFREILPRVLIEQQTGDGYVVVETAVAGLEGRRWLRARGNGISAMTAAASAIAHMHRRTATPRVLDDGWAERWIDAPIRVIAAANGYCLRGDRRAAALKKLSQTLRAAFLGREADIGLGHGDLWPGNLFYRDPDDQPEGAVLTGIIDWDTARTDALAALDLCHLALTFRMEERGEELGPVVLCLFNGAGWSLAEMGVFDAAGVRGEVAVAGSRQPDRTLVLLTWLHHVATVLAKADRMSGNALWAAVNVDRVLQSAILSGPEAST